MATSSKKFQELAAEIEHRSKELAEAGNGLPAPTAKKVRRAISLAQTHLGKVTENLDPIKHPGFVFDPSNPEITGRMVGITMIAQDRKPLAYANVDRFYGSGVYAIYYKGDFPAYTAISRREHPIYVGKADPAKRGSKTATEQGDKLCARLNEHRRNIARATTTIELRDFEYRALVVQTGWQAAAEEFLIDLFKPIWNKICYGFGKHGDEFDTRSNLRSPWDTLHPGRAWAADVKAKDARSKQQIVDDIAAHFAKSPPLSTVQEILLRFLEEMRTRS